MSSVSVESGHRWWSAALMAGSGVAAVLSILIGGPGSAAAAALFALSGVLVALSQGASSRDDSRLLWAAVGAAAMASALLAWLDDRTPLVIAVLATAGLVGLVVVVLTVHAFTWSLAGAPEWLVDADSRGVEFRERALLSLARWRDRLRQHPRRSPQRVYRLLLRDSSDMVWCGPTGRPIAFSHLNVRLHPQTAAALDEWVPLEAIAADAAQNYADVHAEQPRRSASVAVLISTDPRVPVGSNAVAGSFREAESVEVIARASARLTGPYYGSRGARPADQLATPQRDGARVSLISGSGSAQSVGRASATQVLGPRPKGVLGEPGTAESAQRGELVLRRCEPGGAVIPGAQEYRLPADRTWTAGRSSTAGIPLPEKHVSRQHLDLMPGLTGWLVVDRSSLGTTLNGRRLPPGTPTRIASGDILELGGTSDSSEQRVLLQVV